MGRFGSVRINRKHYRVQELLAHVMHAIEPYIKENGETNNYREAALALEDLFDTTGAYIVTDAIRAEAGLPIRDGYGLTLDELHIIEAKMLVASLSGPAPIFRAAPTREE